MAFFKYSFLNSLRDELWLTMTRQRATLFLFLYLALPGAGLGAGIGWAAHSHSLLKTAIAGAIGLVLGGVIAWLLPRALWNMLRLFARKGWFLEPEHPQGVPAMTADEFLVRSKALMGEGRRHSLVWVLILIVGALGFSRLCFWMDRQNPPAWIQLSAAFGILAFFAGYVVLSRRAWKRRVRKLGLQCPTCGREITNLAGLPGVPPEGLCRHCGAKVIET